MLTYGQALGNMCRQDTFAHEPLGISDRKALLRDVERPWELQQRGHATGHGDSHWHHLPVAVFATQLFQQMILPDSVVPAWQSVAEGLCKQRRQNESNLYREKGNFAAKAKSKNKSKCMCAVGVLHSEVKNEVLGQEPSQFQPLMKMRPQT